MNQMARGPSFCRRLGWALLLSGTVLLFSGCGHKRVSESVPAAPPIAASGSSAEPGSPTPETYGIQPGAKPLLVESGIASWYGAPYHNRRASNGEIYDMHAMTAAHRTLPLGSVVRVTNPANQKAVMVRITDRGPFIEGRIIDLSHAAARQIGLVQKGTAEVRVELLKTPAPIDAGGRWAVQIGGFGKEESARELAGHLSQRYRTAKVLTFGSPAGDWWVRVRVKNDLRARAEEVLHDTRTREGGIFLVRLD